MNIMVWGVWVGGVLVCDVYLIVMGYVWGLNQKHAGDRGFQKQVFRFH